MTLDAWWEDVLKVRFPQLQDFDHTRDSSHVMHSLITILGFGGLGMLAGGVAVLVADAPLSFVGSAGLASGIIGGLTGYAIREAWPRLRGRDRSPVMLWDGALDVLVPAMVAGPWAWCAYTGPVPAWSGPALYACAAAVAWLYSFARPDGALHYGPDH